MERIVREGRAGFYEGETARTLVEAVRAAGGIWTETDLAEYRVVEREPLVAQVGKLRIVVPPPPSAGGVALIESLQILEPFPLARMEPVPRAHLVVEALRRAFRDRGYLGDPDFVTMPIARLTDPAYAAGLRSTIRLDRATPSETFAPLYRDGGGTQTTHFSIIDAEGNRAAGTVSLNSWFGNGMLVPGLDILLNNEMDDFTLQRGFVDQFELVGADANAVLPGKRMLSSMTPAFLESERGVAILGTPGGSRIISMTLLSTLAWMEGADARTMVSLPRYHHQYLPDEIVYETGAFTAAQLEELRRMGHSLEESGRRYGNMAVVTWDYAGGRLEAASDPRAEGVGRVY
jgi:gamma-glutamyltranspeptidase/glutathione hydrolase